MSTYLYLTCYDITEPKRQALIRHAIKNHSITGQKSAYECWLSSQQREDLIHSVTSQLQSGDAFCMLKIINNYWHSQPKPCHVYTPNSQYLYIG